jgi:glycosyltransferase involved in cell wall biosynthesis
MSIPFELILVDDASEDNTRALVDEFLQKSNLENLELLRSVKFFSTDVPIFETKADSYGISQATSEYILEIQADMKIIEHAFDQTMLDVLTRDENIFALSARGVHGFDEISKSYLRAQSSSKFDIKHVLRTAGTHYKFKLFNGRAFSGGKEQELFENFDFNQIFPDQTKFKNEKRAGWLGRSIDNLPESLNENQQKLMRLNKKKIWIGNTIMRGPIIFNKSQFEEIGGFDVQSFYLGNDDHNLCLNAKKSGKKVGFTPIHFTAPLVRGTERAHKTVRSLFWRELHRFARTEHLKKTEIYEFLIKD